MATRAMIFALALSSVNCQLFQVNDSTVQFPQQAGNSYPIGDVRNCAVNMHSGIGSTRYPKVLEALPGLGFDNLQNFDMDRIHLLNYSKCKTTSDGKYILPDGYFVIPRHGTNIKLFSELFQNWYDYTSITSSSINVGGFLGLKLFSIGGSYSEEKRRVKTQQVHENSVTTRVQLRRTLYTIKLDSSVPLHPEFRKRVYEIAASISGQQLNLARYYSELLIRDYGTHYLTSIDVGGVFVKNDYVSRDLMNSGMLDETSLTSSAAFNFPGYSVFNETFELGLSSRSSQNLEQNSQLYKQNIKESDLMTIGGPPVTEEISISSWQNGIGDNLAIIDRFGDPISFAITSTNFPEIQEASLREVAKLIQDAAEMYFKDNTVTGCTDPNEEGFNFQANNPDNDACGNNNSSRSYLDRSFGGIYQTCSRKTGREDLCSDIQQTNPLTGHYSCPGGYQDISLHSGSASVTNQYSKTKRECSFIFFCNHVVHYYTETTTAHYEIHWCAGTDQSQQYQAYLFGGYYSSLKNNPFTTTRSCPLYYQPHQFGNDVQICTTSDYELGRSRSVNFGGFFSCSVGNPLADGPNVTRNVSLWTQSCPIGYNQHLITIDSGCEINACLEKGSFGSTSLLLPTLPPYRTPQFNPNGSEPVAILGSRNTVLIKNTRGEWETFDLTDPVTIKLLQSLSGDPSQMTMSSSGSAGNSPSQNVTGIEVAALFFALLATVLVIILIAVVIYKTKRLHSHSRSF